MDRFQQLVCFARTVETGSFSATARELGIGQSSVSRYIAALEERLGSRLLHRSTRRLTLTPEGEHYYTEIRQALDAIAEADSGARGEGKPSGLLRVSCPTSVGLGLLIPSVRKFLERYPEIQLDLQIIDRYVDLIEEGVDLAIRIGALKDSGLHARRIGTSERICVASVDYVNRRGLPKTPADLRNHDCILYTLLAAGNTWPFGDSEIAVSGNLRLNTTEGIHRAVLAGLGIAHGPLWLYEKDLRAGRVQQLLRDYIGKSTPINIVYSARRLLPRRAIVFMDFLAGVFSEIPAVNDGALERLDQLQTGRREALLISVPKVPVVCSRKRGRNCRSPR